MNPKSTHLRAKRRSLASIFLGTRVIVSYNTVMKFRRVLLVILWMLVIFYWSSVPELNSGLEVLWDTVLRKLAHISEFAILAGLVTYALGRRRWQLELALMISAAYAVSDEIHQLFVRQRVGSIIDVGIDVAGIIIGLLLYKKLFLRRGR